MKFLKSHNISRYSPSDNTLHVTPTGRAVMDINGALMVPKGTGDDSYSPGTTQNQRPIVSGVRQPGDGNATYPGNGYIRFNTTTDCFEGYINGVWEVIRAPGASAVTKETLGPGDDVSTLYGPLKTVPTGTSYQSSDHNIMVYVDNVFQISPTNFEVTQNPSSTGDGAEVQSGSFTTGVEYIITSSGVTDFVTEHGAADNNPGTVFTAAGAGTSDPTGGYARPTGYYLEFTSAVPSLSDLGNPIYITVYYGFEN